MSRAFLPTIAPRSWLLAVTLAGAVWLTPSAAQGMEPVTLTVGVDFVDIQTHIPHERSVLRIAGPDGYALTLHVPVETALIEADLLWDAEPRMTQQDADLEAWSSLPVGTYHYEVVLYADGKVVGRTHGVFDVEADGRAIEKLPPLGEPLSSATPTGGLRHALDAVLGFLMPAAHAQITQTEDLRIRKLTPSLILDSTATADGDNWLIQGDTSQWSFRDELNNNAVFSIFPGAGNGGALNILGGGNVGVGTSAPQRKLHVSGGDVRISPLVGASWDINPGNVGLFFNRVGGSFGVLRLDGNAPENSIVATQAGVGIGIADPVRQLHLRGTNATFRMDRDQNTAAFILVRTTPAGEPLKTFVVGTDAFGSNNGEFIINDLGTEVGGPGTRRMTINNDGNVIFTGTVSQSSSARYKRDIEPLEAAGESLQQLRGVRFVRKESGRPSLGLIAEEVATVYPELVETQNGEVEAVNYSALVAVLVEAFKEQQARIDAKEQALAAQHTRMLHLEARLATFEALEARLSDLESLLIGRELQATTLPQR